MSLIENIGINLISDLIFLVLVTLLAFMGGVIWIRSRRRRIMRFFGISQTRRIVVYLSNIRVVQGGSIGVDGVSRSFSGETVSFEEMRVAGEFANLFAFPFPKISQSLSGFLSGWLVDTTRIQLQRSPVSETEIDRSTCLVTLGSPAYNIVSQCVEQDTNCHAKFSEDMSSITAYNLPPIDDVRYSFLQKITDRDKGTVYFYAAGLSILGTVGAVQYLCDQWADLEKEHRDKGFTVLLVFTSNNLKDWQVVLNREHE